jgi:ubiquinone/menaquinone biosynthesis C-methylase UbiE
MPPTPPPLSGTYYSDWASVYDAVATAPGIRSWRQHAVETLELAGDETVVEMGCGTGANLPYLRDHVGPDGQIVGIDIVEAMLAEARTRIDRSGWTNVHIARGDATQPPICAADAVLSTFLVGMLEDPDDAVTDWLRLVRPGGRVTLLNATRSDMLLARPLNLGCRAFVRLTAPGHRLRPSSPVRELEDRWTLAKESLFEGTVDHVEASFGFGFVQLASGRVPEPAEEG